MKRFHIFDLIWTNLHPQIENCIFSEEEMEAEDAPLFLSESTAQMIFIPAPISREYTIRRNGLRKRDIGFHNRDPRVFSTIWRAPSRINASDLSKRQPRRQPPSTSEYCCMHTFTHKHWYLDFKNKAVSLDITSSKIAKYQDSMF